MALSTMMGPAVAGRSRGASAAAATRNPGPTAIHNPKNMVRRIRIKVAASADFDGVIIAKRRQVYDKKLVNPPRNRISSKLKSPVVDPVHFFP